VQVFLSWSGQRSKAVASALKELLPPMLHSITCWMSENDILKGKPWFEELTKALNSIVFAIVCVTRENTNSPWMLWEAGFLSSASGLGDRHIVPLAIGLKKESLGGPLSVYQAVDTSREDFLRLVKRINEAVDKDKRIEPDVLESTFRYIWPELDKKLEAAAAIAVDEAPPPPEETGVVQAEILGLLRQQQRETANLRATIEEVINKPVLPLSHYITPPTGALTLSDLARNPISLAASSTPLSVAAGAPPQNPLILNDLLRFQGEPITSQSAAELSRQLAQIAEEISRCPNTRRRYVGHAKAGECEA